MRKELEFLIFPQVKFRRIRAGMIELYKILTRKYDSLVSPHFHLSSGSVTRGNSSTK